jgi:hypothetical protein
MTDDPVAHAARTAIDQLTRLLSEARGYLEAGENRAAIGTLVSFDDQVEDLRAAIRLLRMTAQGRRR